MVNSKRGEWKMLGALRCTSKDYQFPAVVSCTDAATLGK